MTVEAGQNFSIKICFHGAPEHSKVIEVDRELFNWFNRWNGQSDFFDTVLFVFQTPAFKAAPFMMAVWALWFWPETREHRTRIREALSAVLLCAVPVMLLTRVVANYAPFSARPIHTPDLALNLYGGQSVRMLDGWSSMPSDHASLFFGFAVAILTVHRIFGTCLLFWAVFVSSVPRIIMGLHWPSDVLAGWFIGGALAFFLVRPVTTLVRNAGFVPYLEKREAIGYPLLFLATFEIANMFSTSRLLVEKLM